MQSRGEQVRAYRFVTRRVVSALLSGEPETTDLPMRRLGMALVGSLVVAAIILGGVGAYGLLRPGGGHPADNSLIIERETGARYVYIRGTLYPVANFASALLILGTPDPTIQTLSRNSLRGLTRSRQIYGIQGAPDSLPDPHDLSGLPWSVCSAPRSADSTAPATRILVGSQPLGGTPVGDSGLLVVIQGTTNKYLLWHDHALRIVGGVPLAALGMAAATALPVGAALINGTVAGPDLRVPIIDGDGTPSNKTINGQPATIGSVYRDERGQHYVMLSNGLSTIGEPMADLLLASGRHDNTISTGVAGSMLTTRKIEPEGFPTEVPKLVQPTDSRVAVCTVYSRVTDSEVDTSVLLYASVPAQLVPSTGETAVVQTNRSVATADFVTVSRQGALVEPVSAPGAAGVGNTVYLVTAGGFRYPLDNAGGDAKAALGYAAVTPVEVPVALVGLIPLGPTLSIAGAQNLPSSSPSPTGAASGAVSPSPSR
jgi:type VII secretion protein EccB